MIGEGMNFGKKREIFPSLRAGFCLGRMEKEKARSGCVRQVLVDKLSFFS